MKLSRQKEFHLKYLLGVLLFLASHASWGGCPRAMSSTHIVVTIEGLGGRVFGSKARTVARSVNQSGYDIADFTHNTPASTIAKCVQEWKKAHGNKTRVSILGHSMGGPTADKVARELIRYGTPVNAMFLFDSRHGSDQFACGRRSPQTFAKPSNVKKLINFHQCGALAGRRYSGSGVENIELNGVPHGSLPQSTPAINRLSSILNGLTSKQSNPSAPLLAQSSPTEQLQSASSTSEYESPFLFKASSRSQTGDRWSKHPKANQSAWCFRGGARYECTWQEASRQSYSESQSGA